MKVSSGTDAPWRDEQLLREKYLHEELTMVEVAEEFDCHHVTISTWLDKHGIKKRDCMGRFEEERPWEDRDWLYDKYVEQRMSQTEIADEVDVGHVTISRWMKRHGINSRDLAESHRMVYLRDHVPLQMDGEYPTWQHSWRWESDTISVHRLLAVSEYGFDEVCDKVVHHKNGIPWDNRPENLEVLTKSEHTKHHIENGDIPLPPQICEKTNY